MFQQRLKKAADRRGARWAVASNAVDRRGNAVKTLRSPSRTPCGGVYFEHAQNKRLGLAIAKRVRQLAVGSSRAPLARCEYAFKSCI